MSDPLWLFWGQPYMSFLRYMTLKSACLFHGDVRLVVRSTQVAPTVSWKEARQDFSFGAPLRDWMLAAKSLPLSIHELSEVAPEVAALGAPDTQTKDLLMYYVMSHFGGTYADMDIVFLKEIPEIQFDVQVPVIECEYLIESRTKKQRDAGVAFPGLKKYVPVGFVQGRPCEEWEKAERTAFDQYDPDDYQCCVFCLDQNREGTLPEKIVYPWAGERIQTVADYCFAVSHWPPVSGDCCGIHWYAGASVSQKNNQRITGPEDVGDRGAVPRAIKMVLA